MNREQREAAEAFAQWHLGDPWWADAIFGAAKDPEATWRKLAAAGMERAQEREEGK